VAARVAPPVQLAKESSLAVARGWDSPNQENPQRGHYCTRMSETTVSRPFASCAGIYITTRKQSQEEFIPDAGPISSVYGTLGE